MRKPSEFTKFYHRTMDNMIIRVEKAGRETDEWAVIELQGDLVSRSGRSMRDQFIGDIHFTKNGTPILIIGHHILFGKEMTLDKPLAVLKRLRIDKTDPSSNVSLECDSPETRYQVGAIVVKKLVFRARPKPIITNMPKVV